MTWYEFTVSISALSFILGTAGLVLWAAWHGWK